MYIYSSKTAYINTVSKFIVREYHLLINFIIIMIHSVMSVTTGEYFLVKFTPEIWVCLRSTKRALHRPFIFFLKTNFLSIKRLFGEVFHSFGFFPYSLIYNTPELFSNGYMPEWEFFWIFVM